MPPSPPIYYSIYDGTGMERERNGDGTGMEREWNGNGTGMEQGWNGDGTGMEQEYKKRHHFFDI